MMKITLSITCLLLIVYCNLAIGKSIKESDEIDADAFLEKYGYLQPVDFVNGGALQSREAAIREYQRFNGLPVTGNLDQATIEKMKQPRCGLPDMDHQTQTHAEFRLPNTQPKWSKNKVTWRPLSYTSKLSVSTQIGAIKSAFKHWSDVTPLTFERTTGMSDIEISFARGNHGDGAGNSFDGKGGVLAHAYYPGRGGIAGDAHFDQDEDWSQGTGKGTDLEITAAHEFGHALGLAHSDVRDALMAPYYRYTPDMKLHRDDVRGIQYLYGAKETVTTTTTTPKTTTTTTTIKPRVWTTKTPVTRSPTSCDIPIEASFQGADGFTYAFAGGKVYRIDRSGIVSGFPVSIRSLFPKGPYLVHAAVHSKVSGKTYLFKYRKVYRFSGFALDAGYPKTMSAANYPRSPDAAFWLNNQIYLIKGTNLYSWNEASETIPSIYPLQISRYFVGLPRKIDSVVNRNDGYIYYIKGQQYFKLDNRIRRVTSSGRVSSDLLGCP